MKCVHCGFETQSLTYWIEHCYEEFHKSLKKEVCEEPVEPVEVVAD